MLADENTILIARPVRQSDEGQLLEWANDPLTRRNSFSCAQISPESHQLWFSRRLGSVDCQIYLVETEAGLSAGQVRFERAQGAWEVHFTLSPVLRGRGLGPRLLKAALDNFVQLQPKAVFFGRVKPANRPSRRIFEALDFRLVSVAADIATYQFNHF